MELKIEAGRYYRDNSGNVVGPMMVVAANPEFFVVKYPGNMWHPDGRRYMQSHTHETSFAYEVAAPGFEIEHGDYCELANGRTVGPFESEDDYFAIEGEYSTLGEECRQVWNADGTVFMMQEDEQLFHAVRKVDKPDGDTEGLKLEIKVSPELQAMIEDARAEIEAAAERAMKAVEERDEEIRALKKSFNISREEVEGHRLRISNLNKLLDGKNEHIRALYENQDGLTEALNRSVIAEKDANERASASYGVVAKLAARQGKVDERLRKLRLRHREVRAALDKANERLGAAAKVGLYEISTFGIAVFSAAIPMALAIAHFL